MWGLVLAGVAVVALGFAAIAAVKSTEVRAQVPGARNWLGYVGIYVVAFWLAAGGWWFLTAR